MHTRSFKVDGQAQTETWHSNVVEESGPATGAIIHREITIPDQQNELAVEFVTEYTCNLIVEFRRASAGIAPNDRGKFRRVGLPWSCPYESANSPVMKFARPAVQLASG